MAAIRIERRRAGVITRLRKRLRPGAVLSGESVGCAGDRVRQHLYGSHGSLEPKFDLFARIAAGALRYERDFGSADPHWEVGADHAAILDHREGRDRRLFHSGTL